VTLPKASKTLLILYLWPTNIHCDYVLGPQIIVGVQAAIKEKAAEKEAKKTTKKTTTKKSK